MGDNNKGRVYNALIMLTEPDNFQKYILGTKKNGQPRAAYDIIKDLSGCKKGKKKKKKKKGNKCDYQSIIYADVKKKKKGKKHKKHWHY